MNPTDIADALFAIAKTPFDATEFGFLFAEATDNAQATVSKLRLGTTNKSDLPNGILASRKFHYAPATHDTIENTLKALRTSKKTASFKPSILITSDGHSIAAEQLKSGEPLHCEFNELGKNFEFFLPAAGMERYEGAKEHPIDIAATGRLAKLYDALLKVNPDWAAPERRHDMNLFMTRLIFCLFSEDVGIFDDKQFSYSVFSLSGNKGEHARETIVQAFTAMSLPQDKRENLPTWSNNYKYVNGGLFADKIDAPKFDTIAFRYLRDAAEMDWRQINPDIFGSMIQSIADPKARSELGMHYTSVPNIMKVLGPLFLDDLDAAIEKAWDKPSALHAQLKRLGKIRIFDPACGSGNFLVIAYREMRKREIRILQRLNELGSDPTLRMFSFISLNQFYGIEITDFAAETAKLSLFIAEYQSNTHFANVFGRMPALLPLREGGRIKCGNQSTDGGHLILSPEDRDDLILNYPSAEEFIRPYVGSLEVVRGLSRYCLWIKDQDLDRALQLKPIALRVNKIKLERLGMKDAQAQKLAHRPHQFREHNEAKFHSILVPRVTSERRPYLPVERVSAEVISSDLNQVLYDAPDWCIALIASRLHLVWIATVCGKLKSDFRYSSTLGWNTFPVPKFTPEQLEQLSASARRILKTRYAHYPATIADLYDPDKMPDDLRQVHRENDDLLESMYIGRPFRNDTERLEKLFKLYAAKIVSKGVQK